MYVLEINRVVDEVLRRGAKKVLLQLPDGLKREGLALARAIEGRTGATVILSCGRCYGACDLALDEALALGADLTFHYGHSAWRLSGIKTPVFFVEAKSEVGVTRSIKEAATLLDGIERVGLAAPLQLVHKLHAAQRLLREMGKRVLIGDKAPGVAYDGQVTGCNYGSAISVAGRVEAFVVLGGGTFHALGLALATGKMTIAADPFLNDAVDVAPMRRRVLKQRWALISKAEGYDSFGVIVGLKPGQRRLKEAMGVKARLERHGKQAVLLSISDVDDEALRSFEDIDAFVNTACPRVAIDDLAGFSRPMFLPAEIDVAMGEARWDADNPLPINDHFRLILG